MSALVLRDVELGGRSTDVLVEDGHIGAIGGSVPAPPHADELDGRGGALLPGLWDHHIHLVALAAAQSSVVVGPPEVTDEHQLAAVLRGAPRSEHGWVRGVGYHESVAGAIDRTDLDRLVPDGPARLQHRSGAMWVLNGAAIERLGLDHESLAGAERDADGRLTGRLYGADRWLGARLRRDAPEAAPDLAAVGRQLAGYGVVGVTDATPYPNVTDLDLLAGAASSGALPQRVVAMGGVPLAATPFPPPLQRGPVKVVLADHSLPSLDELVAAVAAAHDADRPVAMHCVTRVALVLALAALDLAGSRPGDRIEHGAIVPPELRGPLAGHRVTVVTQPGFVFDRGDQYLDEVDADDRPHLYPCASLRAAGVPVAGSTDAPFGDPDPWRAIASAVERQTRDGQGIGADEAVPPDVALGLLLGAPDDPGGPARLVQAGAPADLCLLDAPLADALTEPSSDRVLLTVVGGKVVHG